MVSWGNEEEGGNCGAVLEQLAADVHHIYSTGRAFAALKVDGSVVTWGHASFGGNCDAAREQLVHCRKHVHFVFVDVHLPETGGTYKHIPLNQPTSP